MKFPETYSSEQITGALNSLHAPYLEELNILCKAISSSIDEGWADYTYQAGELSGKFAALRGVLKELELINREVKDIDRG
jgi:hypothetical protein